MRMGMGQGIGRAAVMGGGLPYLPPGYRFLTETINGTVYYLTETVNGVKYFLAEMA